MTSGRIGRGIGKLIGRRATSGDPGAQLADHLMTFYGRRTIGADSPLLARFYRKANGALRAVAIIGLPLGLISLGLWLLGLYLAKIFVAAWVGQGLKEAPAGKAGQFVLALLLGLVIVFVAVNLPYVGALLRFLIWLMGLGVLFSRVRLLRRGAPAA
jgi:hypothetical protein